MIAQKRLNDMADYKFEIVMQYLNLKLIRYIYPEFTKKPDWFVIKDYSRPISKNNPKMGKILVSGFNCEESKTLFKQVLKDKEKWDTWNDDSEEV